MASAWGSSWGSAWGDSWGSIAAVTIDTHDGFDGKKPNEARKRKERLHNQLEEAFYDAFGGRPVLPPVMARNDEPLQEFVFPAYRESPVVDEDDEEAAALLLTT